MIAEIVVQASLLMVIVGSLLPLIVSLVTKSNASEKVKVSVAAIISAIAAGITAIVGPAETVLLSQETLMRFFVAFAAATISYKTAGRALGINDKLAPSKGIG